VAKQKQKVREEQILGNAERQNKLTELLDENLKKESLKEQRKQEAALMMDNIYH
jgi:hypothetical protein